jgi:hypothetical protein
VVRLASHDVELVHGIPAGLARTAGGSSRDDASIQGERGCGSALEPYQRASWNLGPKELTTNITVPSITAGKAALYFLPDRVLVREGKGFSDVAYAHLGVRPGQTRFIEDSAPPGDALRVDQTWQYVNVKGGPDRRYKNN